MLTRTVAVALLAFVVLTPPVLARDYAGGAIKSLKLANGHELLTDAAGMTLYTYDPDSPGVSTCSGLCLMAWPAARAGSGAKPSGDFSLVQGHGGFMWAFRGKPLYLYARDRRPGQVNGDGAEGLWHAAIK